MTWWPTIHVRRSVLEAARALKTEQGSAAIEVARQRWMDGGRLRDTTGRFWHDVMLYLQVTHWRPWIRLRIIEDAGKGWPPVSQPGAEPEKEYEDLDFGAGSRTDNQPEFRKDTESVDPFVAKELKRLAEKKKGGGSQ